MRIAWVLGWAVPETWFAPLACAALPQAEHAFFAASPTWLAQVCASGPWDAIAGHSLGSLLLLEEASAVGRLTPRVALFAPVFAFSAEEARGGKVARAQVRYLAKWLRTDRDAALVDFYARAGLAGCAPHETPLGLLQWGLVKLEQSRVEAPLPDGWRAYAGTDDTLLDAEILQQIDPAVVRVAGGTHHPEALMRAWAEVLP